eukprot:55343_1
MSLLMYIYQFCDQLYPNVSRDVERLYGCIKRAKHVDWDEVKRIFKTVDHLMEQLTDLISNVADDIYDYDCTDTFIMVMTKFHKKANEKWKKMRMTFSGVTIGMKRTFKTFLFAPTLCMECFE